MNREPVLENRHHCLWPYRAYNTAIEKRVRNLGSLIVRGNVDYHKELHAMVEPPPKLNRDQYYDLYNFMQDQNYEIGGMEGLEWAIVWSGSRKLYEFEDNLLQQHYYLSGQHLEKFA